MDKLTYEVTLETVVLCFLLFYLKNSDVEALVLHLICMFFK